MLGEIEVLKPGLFSTIQDSGRFGFRDFGVPLSGPMDTYSSCLGNMILNNSPDDPVLEITQTGPKLKFGAPANIVITGAKLSPEINGDIIRNNRIYSLMVGDVLSFGRRETGSRAYVTIQGGFKCDKVLGSCSWYDGLTSYFRLDKGMILNFSKEDQKILNVTTALRYKDKYLMENKIPAFPGPEFHKLSTALQSQLFNTTFSIDPANNRMAIQLQENFKNSLEPIISGPVIPGTVQLTASGKIIILMRDCQTTGGYPRMLQVTREGLNILAQKVTGDKVKFDLLNSVP